MGVQTGTSKSTTPPKRYGKMHPAVPVRDLVATLTAKTSQKLFGANEPLGTTSFRGQVPIEDGNVATFLNARAEHFGLTGVKTSIGKSLDEAIIDVAKQVVQQATKPANLNADQLQRIALEYVMQACCIDATAIEPFQTYLANAMEYRQAVKALNAAAANSEPATFQGSDGVLVESRNAAAKKAWGTITALGTASQHLRTLRTTIAAPFIYAAMEAWKALQAFDATTRQAVIGQLRCMVAESGSPFVSETEVWNAYARVQGSELLSTGNAFGVGIETAVGAIGQSRLAQVKPNGGQKVTLVAGSPAAIGAAIGALRGDITGEIAVQDGRTIGLNLQVREGLPGTGSIAVPLPSPAFGRQQQHASA